MLCKFFYLWPIIYLTRVHPCNVHTHQSSGTPAALHACRLCACGRCRGRHALWRPAPAAAEVAPPQCSCQSCPQASAHKTMKNFTTSKNVFLWMLKSNCVVDGNRCLANCSFLKKTAIATITGLLKEKRYVGTNIILKKAHLALTTIDGLPH